LGEKFVKNSVAVRKEAKQNKIVKLNQEIVTKKLTKFAKKKSKIQLNDSKVEISFKK
jgi:hypothetical protein